MNSKTNRYKYIFGPVPSRRFGRSLGVDLIPFKTCDFNCVFCQLGSESKTTNLRREYVPIAEVKAEIIDWQRSGGETDVVTLSGSGEPTLHSRFGDIMDFVRTKMSVPTVLLTNSSTMAMPEVRMDAAKASIVKASLSAWDQSSFERINRPAETLEFQQIVEGLHKFRQLYSGELRIEVFVLGGYNDAPSEAEKIAKIVDYIGADLVQLNTAVRPPAEKVRPVSAEHLETLAVFFTTPSEVIADNSFKSAKHSEATSESLLAMIARHPCNVQQICELFDIDSKAACGHLNQLVLRREIRATIIDGREYFILERAVERR